MIATSRPPLIGTLAQYVNFDNRGQLSLDSHITRGRSHYFEFAKQTHVTERDCMTTPLPVLLISGGSDRTVAVAHKASDFTVFFSDSHHDIT